VASMNDVTTISDDDDKSSSHSTAAAAAAAAAALCQLKEMSLSADRSHNIDRVLTENCSSSDVAVDSAAVVDAADNHACCWMSDGLVNEPSNNSNVDDQLTSADNDCDGSITDQQQSASSSSDLPSNNHIAYYEDTHKHCVDNSESLPVLSVELFSCKECSVRCSKQFAQDSLHVIVDVIRHSDVDCSVFDDASLTFVTNRTYLIEVT